MEHIDELETLYDNVGKNIAYFRKKQGLSQEKLGNLLILPQTTISQYEKARRRPRLDTIQQFANFFKVPLEEFLFHSFYLEKETVELESDKEITSEDPIRKCAGCTYYCYYIKEQNQGSDGIKNQVASFKIEVSKPIASHQADVKIIFYEKTNPNAPYSGRMRMDEKYAYIDCHVFERDFFLQLIFYYHRDKGRGRYAGGVAFLQRLGFNEVAVSQYCVISRSAISEERRKDLWEYLKLNTAQISKDKSSLSKRRFSSSGVFRLTKGLDAEVFDWLKRNKYI